MPWGKMDDKFHRNPKVRALRRMKGGREALGVWVYWWSWCLDDPSLTGFVPEDELSGVDAKAAALLCEVGLWDKTDHGYQFHDFSDYNPTREKLEAKRAADRKRIAADREMEKLATAPPVASDTGQMSQATTPDVASDSSATDCATNRDVASLRARWDGNGSSSESSASGELSPEHRAVVRGYKLRYENHKHTPWLSYAANYTEIVNISYWVERTAVAHRLKITQVTAAMLDEFFVDTFAENTGFSLALLAKDPGKYFTRNRQVQSLLESRSQRDREAS